MVSFDIQKSLRCPILETSAAARGYRRFQINKNNLGHDRLPIHNDHSESDVRVQANDKCVRNFSRAPWIEHVLEIRAQGEPRRRLHVIV